MGLNSIAGRTTAIVVGATVVVLVVVALALDRALTNELREEFDRQLLVRAQGLTILTDVDDDSEIEFDFDAEMMPSFLLEHPSAEYFVIRDDDGEVIAQSDSLQGDADRVLPQLDAVGDDPFFHELTLPDGRAARKVTLAFTPRLDIDSEDEGSEERAAELAMAGLPVLSLTVARGTESLVNLTSRVRSMLAMGAGALLLAMVFLIRLGITRGLRPVRALTAEVASLDQDNLDVRVTEPVGASELLPVSNHLNQALQKLEEAFHRERSFSGNVAHELRTPIAELRSYAEVGRKWPRDEKLAEKFFGELVGLADDMERTVVNLMMLSRLDSGEIETDIADVDLTQLIDKAWSRLRVQAEEHNSSLELNAPAALMVKTDAGKLALIVSNLFSNAISHSPEGSTVTVDAQVHGDEVNITVSNRADDLRENDLRFLFDRFWRKDTARTAGRHVGLGLSIVKALSDVLGVRVDPRLSDQRDFEVTLGGLSAAS